MTEIDSARRDRRPWEDPLPGRNDGHAIGESAFRRPHVPTVPPPLCCVPSGPRDTYHDLDIPPPKGKDVKAARLEYAALQHRIATQPEHRKRASWIFHARELVRVFGRKNLNVRPTGQAKQARRASLYVELIRSIVASTPGKKRDGRILNATTLAHMLGRNLTDDVKAERAKRTSPAT